MRYLKKFNEDNKNDIVESLEDFGIIKYTINDDFSVDVDGDVDISGRDIERIPFTFIKVSGNFDCSSNKITTLNKLPKEIGGNLNASINYNISSMSDNSCVKVGGNFDISFSDITDMVGGPKYVGGDLYIMYCNIETFDGFPKSFKNLISEENPIDLIIDLFPVKNFDNYELFCDTVSLKRDGEYVRIDREFFEIWLDTIGKKINIDEYFKDSIYKFSE